MLYIFNCSVNQFATKASITTATSLIGERNSWRSYCWKLTGCWKFHADALQPQADQWKLWSNGGFTRNKCHFEKCIRTEWTKAWVRRRTEDSGSNPSKKQIDEKNKEITVLQKAIEKLEEQNQELNVELKSRSEESLSRKKDVTPYSHVCFVCSCAWIFEALSKISILLSPRYGEVQWHCVKGLI